MKLLVLRVLHVFLQWTTVDLFTILVSFVENMVSR